MMQHSTARKMCIRDSRWVTRQELPELDFLEADLGLVKDLAAGKIL